MQASLGATVNGANFCGTTGKGFTAQQLYSTASYKAKNLNGIGLESNNLTGWNFAGQNLSNADIRWTNLTNANFTSATVTGTLFGLSNLTASQLYSTASYKAKTLHGIGLSGDNLTGWNFAGQNLTNAFLLNTRLSSANFAGANLSDADLRGATGASLGSAKTHDTILPNGTISGLSLTAGETLTIPNSPVAIHVAGTPTFNSAATIQMFFDGKPWGSTMSFNPGTSLTLAGNLELDPTLWLNIGSLEDESFQLFNWTGVSISGAFHIVGDPRWDTSQLYATGFVTFDSPAGATNLASMGMESSAIPEPSTLVLLGIGAVSVLAWAWRRRKLAA